MKKNILYVLLCIVVCAGYSQENKLLQNYKYRINKFQALNVEFNNAANKENTYFNLQKPKVNNFNTQLAANYNRLTITNNKYTNFNIGVSSNYNTAKSQNEVSNSKTSNFSIAPQFNIQNKWFYKNKFIQFDFGIANGNEYGKQYESYNAQENKNSGKVNYIQSNATIGVGKGRLENITDMQNALWLHKILKQEQQLNRALTETELLELAQTVTKANTRRILDNRQQRKFILKTIDNYLQSKNVIKKSDIEYFTNLNDVVFFANNLHRLSGLEKYVRINPSITSSKYNREQLNTPFNKQNNKNDIQSVIVKLGFEKYKPLRLKQQINYGINLIGVHTKLISSKKDYINSILQTDTKGTIELNQIGGAYFFEYGLYPNTRTIFNLSLSGENGKEYFRNQSSVYHKVALALLADYFINYNTRFNIAIGENYNYSKFNSNTSNIPNGGNLHFSFNCGLKVAI
jgi:hypothetical protein